MPDVPEILHHYTSLGALGEILKSRSLWATDLWYLNDLKEGRYAVDLVREHVQTVVPDADSRTQSDLNMLSRLIERLTDLHSIYVVCFSGEPNQLGQWRAYAQGGGVAMAFKTKQLEELARAHEFILHRCEYSGEQQRKQVAAFVRDSLRAIDTNRGPNQEAENVTPEAAKSIWPAFVKLAPTLKHPSFAEEKEWRLVSKIGGFPFNGVRVRRSGSMLIPFYDLPIAVDFNSMPHRRETYDLPLDHVMIGPTRDHGLAEKAVRVAFTTGDIKRCEIRHSDVPLRDPW